MLFCRPALLLVLLEAKTLEIGIRVRMMLFAILDAVSGIEALYLCNGHNNYMKPVHKDKQTAPNEAASHFNTVAAIHISSYTHRPSTTTNTDLMPV